MTIPDQRRAAGQGAVSVQALSAGFLQLGTPEYYRTRRSLAPGIRDTRDGTPTKDASSWLGRSAAGPVDASITLTPANEPWVYCAAHYRSVDEHCRLKSLFVDGYGYKAGTAIAKPGEFAVRPGVDFVANVDKSRMMRPGSLHRLFVRVGAFADSASPGKAAYSAVVLVHHGPVHYADQSGLITAADD